TTTSPATTTPGQGSSGASVYASYCAGCHGSAGQGGIGPALADRALSEAAIRSATANGVGSMPGFSGSLTAAEIDAVTSYVVGLGTGSGTTPTTSPPGPLSPAGNYAVLCALCHGANGQGTGLGPDIRSESAGEIARYVRQGEDTMPAFGQSALSDQELQELITYIGSFGGGDDSDDDDSDDDSDDDDDDGDDVDSDHDNPQEG
ncbi:MAG: hypothetical protein GY708_14355, partial [Actinomycetia bacterium]|nr:hypothetical protein [Actinomycetes bacterium]